MFFKNDTLRGIATTKFEKRFLKINIDSQLCYFNLGKPGPFRIALNAGGQSSILTTIGGRIARKMVSLIRLEPSKNDTKIMTHSSKTQQRRPLLPLNKPCQFCFPIQASTHLLERNAATRYADAGVRCPRAERRNKAVCRNPYAPYTRVRSAAARRPRPA